jgi:hypothetical protein
MASSVLLIDPTLYSVAAKVAGSGLCLRNDADGALGASLGAMPAAILILKAWIIS